MPSYVSSLKIVRALILNSFVCQPPNPVVAGGVVVGPSTQAQMQLGVVEISDRGFITPALYASLDKAKLPLRCIAPDVAQTEDIKNAIATLFDQRALVGVNRIEVEEPDSGKRFLIHGTDVEKLTAPTNSELKTYWESFVYVCVHIGTEPI